jgi:two-component system KDP operon response regulator KdpE
MTKLLIIEDDIALGEALKISLELHTYETLWATNGPDGLQLAAEWLPDLIILDVMMPGMDGWQVCQRLRETVDTPVVMLTAKALSSDVVHGLGLGADDYVKKPFDLDELTSRIEAVLRRSRRAAAGAGEQYRDETLFIDLRRRVVLRHGHPVHLTPTEFKLLARLVRGQGRPVPHAELLTAVWGPSYAYDETANLAVYIRYLREKLEATPSEPQYICTERGVGYRFGGVGGPSKPAD